MSGDAPLPADLEALAAQHRDVDALGEQKRRVLRALKDLEGEHALGKIDDADYEVIAMRYREEAKALMREMDRKVAPGRATRPSASRASTCCAGARSGGTGRGRQRPRVDARRGRRDVRWLRDVERARRRLLQEVRRSVAIAGKERDATS